MPFIKGQSGNPDGRPNGSVSLVTNTLRVAVQSILDDNIEQFQKDLRGLEPRDRVNTMLRLLEFALPKLQRVENKLDVSRLSAHEVQDIVGTIMQDDD